MVHSQHPPGGEGFKLILTRGEESVCAHMKVKEKKAAAGYVRDIQLLGQEGLAFDHGKIIAAALLKLNETVKVL